MNKELDIFQLLDGPVVMRTKKNLAARLNCLTVSEYKCLMDSLHVSVGELLDTLWLYYGWYYRKGGKNDKET